ncbi:uncharacterized protein, partial [Heterodontus francisci]|uniref:uncharacterized protein n=1 Tax=Heterodontus francisci TaxID=7792 RepID=UPI00355C4F5F
MNDLGYAYGGAMQASQQKFGEIETSDGKGMDGAVAGRWWSRVWVCRFGGLVMKFEQKLCAIRSAYVSTYGESEFLPEMQSFCQELEKMTLALQNDHRCEAKSMVEWTSEIIKIVNVLSITSIVILTAKVEDYQNLCTVAARATFNSGDVERLKAHLLMKSTAIINNELSRLNVDIAALQETRLPAGGSLAEQDYTFFWQGRDPEEPRQHGVGFAIRNSLLSMIEPPSNGSERILSIRLLTTSGPVHLLSIYAPTLCCTPEAKDQFYEELHNIISSIPNTEHLFLLGGGDFNARVGADHDSWPSCLGRYGVGRMNENGQR